MVRVVNEEEESTHIIGVNLRGEKMGATIALLLGATEIIACQNSASTHGWSESTSTLQLTTLVCFPSIHLSPY